LPVTHGFVAFLDVLGFKEQVPRDDFEDVARSYISAVILSSPQAPTMPQWRQIVNPRRLP